MLSNRENFSDLFHFLTFMFTFYLLVRWDFRLKANRNPGNYWMHFRGMVDCEPNKAQAYVIIHYEGAAYLGSWPKDPLSRNSSLRYYSYQPNVRKFN